jgi:hypothetical protein
MNAAVYSYVRMCARKRKFKSEDRAMRQGKKWHQRAYECPCCGQWHLTSQVDAEVSEP